MKKNCAAEALLAGLQIIVQHDNVIISTVRPPQFLMGFGEGPLHWSIVVRVTGFIAPAVQRVNRACSQDRYVPDSLVLADQQLSQGKSANWAFAISFALLVGQTCSAQKARKTAMTQNQGASR